MKYFSSDTFLRMKEKFKGARSVEGLESLEGLEMRLLFIYYQLAFNNHIIKFNFSRRVFLFFKKVK